MTPLSNRIAARLGGANFGLSGDYKFERIKQAKARARLDHPDLRLIDLGVGEPDRGADPMVVRTLAQEAGELKNRWYADNGIPEFQEAAGRFLEGTYGVRGLDPHRQIVHGLGSKSILALLPLCFVDPGDVVLVPTPGYPVLGTHAAYLGGRVHPLPLTPSNGYLPDLDAVPRSVLRRAKLLYLNYPHNPTGAVAPFAFFESVVEFARKNHIVVVHDAAYGALVYGREPLSFLSVPGAMDVGVEVHSLSKTFSMTGWRLAFLAGSPEAIRVFSAVKDHTDSGQFRAIQKAGVTALDHPDLFQREVARYSRRLDHLVTVLRSVGFDATKPPGTFYCYVPVPSGTRAGRRFESAAAFSEFLLESALVSSVPWDEAGPFVRFSATFEASLPEDESQILQELQSRLASLELVFEKEMT